MNIFQKNKWEGYRNYIISHAGKWVGGEDVCVRGKSLANDILPRYSYMQLQVLNITGKEISQPLSKWLEMSFMGLSYPDARIWCNQIAALCGVGKSSPVNAVAASCLAADSRIYGGSQTTFIAMQFLLNTKKQIDAGKTLSEIIQTQKMKNGVPAIVGFARPVKKEDERIGPYIKATKNLGFKQGEYIALALDIAAFIKQHYETDINSGGYCSAFLLDQGFTPYEGYQIRGLAVSSGAAACFSENKEKENYSFLPQRCDDIQYRGVNLRPLKL